MRMYKVEVVSSVEITQIDVVLGLWVGVDTIPRAILLLNIIIYHIIMQEFYSSNLISLLNYYE